MRNRILFLVALLPAVFILIASVAYISTLRDTIQANEAALEIVDKQIMELQYHGIYLEETLVRVVITSETNKYRLDLIEEIFD
jgi:nitrate reductase NapAB chaperone NapD